MEGGEGLASKVRSQCSQVYYSEARDLLVQVRPGHGPVRIPSRSQQRLASPGHGEGLDMIRQVNEALLALEDEITIVSNVRPQGGDAHH